MALLEPDRYFSRISSIDIRRDLLDAGLDHVLLDIDNTILARDTHEIPRDAGVWLGRARDAGIRFCLVSNNWHGSVYELAASIDLPIVAKSCKPFPVAFLRGMGKIGGTRADSVAIGDQLFTDVLGGHLAGIPVFMLQPLVEQDLRHTLWMRNVERVLLGQRQPEGAPVTMGAESPAAADHCAETGFTAAAKDEGTGTVRSSADRTASAVRRAMAKGE